MGNADRSAFSGSRSKAKPLVFTIWSFTIGPFEGFHHFDDIRAEIVIDGRKGISVRGAVTIHRRPEEMAGGVGHKKLAGGGGVSLQIEKDAIDGRLGMGMILLGNRRCERCVTIDKLQGIVGKFAKVVLDGLIGAVDSSIQSGVVDIDPIRFGDIRTRLNDCVAGKGESIGE